MIVRKIIKQQKLCKLISKNLKKNEKQNNNRLRHKSKP